VGGGGDGMPTRPPVGIVTEAVQEDDCCWIGRRRWGFDTLSLLLDHVEEKVVLGNCCCKEIMMPKTCVL
jgi:hypothetical protein